MSSGLSFILDHEEKLHFPLKIRFWHIECCKGSERVIHDIRWYSHPGRGKDTERLLCDKTEHLSYGIRLLCIKLEEGDTNVVLHRI